MNRYTFADLVYSAWVVALPPKLVRAVVARDCDLVQLAARGPAGPHPARGAS